MVDRSIAMRLVRGVNMGAAGRTREVVRPAHASGLIPLNRSLPLLQAGDPFWSWGNRVGRPSRGFHVSWVIPN